MKSCSHSTIQKAASSQLFFSREKRRRIEVSCLSGQRICLRTDDERSTAARESYTRRKKDESHHTGVTTENTAPKAVANRIPQPGQNAAQRYANRTRARIGTSTQTRSYLALNWQRAEIGLPHTSGDRRFPTPRQRRNTRQKGALVTTNHLLFPHSPGASGALLPISQPISNFLRGKSPARTERGGGGAARWAALNALTEKLAWNFMPNGSPTPPSGARKKKPRQLGDCRRPAPAMPAAAMNRYSRELPAIR
jgi:hypothetical protein